MTPLKKWSLTLGPALLTASVLLGVGFVVVGGSASGDNGERLKTTPLPLPAPPRAAVTPQPKPKPKKNAGPEGVPLVKAPPLARAGSPAPGKARGGVPCGSTEQLTYHVHARLSLFVDGKPRSVPLGIGIARPFEVTKSAAGAFASGGRCYSFLHTHAADGIIHVEAPGRVDFKLGQFFAVWGQPLDRGRLGPFKGRVTAYVDGRRYHGDPRRIVLRRHTQIQLAVGRPVRRPVLIDFPARL